MSNQRLVPHQCIDPARFADQMELFERMRRINEQYARDVMHAPPGKLTFSTTVYVDGVAVGEVEV